MCWFDEVVGHAVGYHGSLRVELEVEAGNLRIKLAHGTQNKERRGKCCRKKRMLVYNTTTAEDEKSSVGSYHDMCRMLCVKLDTPVL